MNTKNNKTRRGISTIEMAVAGVIISIGMLGVSGVLSDSQRGWNIMYNRVYSDVVVKGNIAKRMFDTIIRKSSIDGVQIDPDGTWVETCYYENDDSTELDRYARFVFSGHTLYVEHGRLDPRETTSINTVCDNATNCIFKKSGNSVHMLLSISNGSQSMTVGSSAELHN